MTTMKNILIGVIALLVVLAPMRLVADVHEQKAVLITGATTGIGRVAAERLAASGFYVYAGARSQEDIDELNAIENITAVKLDVTKPAEIAAAVEQVRAAGRGLYGLVNNAGVFFGGPQTEVSVEDFEWLMDVNVFGVYRVTRAFAPLLMESKGRIINISSISGTLSGPMFGHYSASKHAVEAMTDTLAVELAGFGVAVSAVEPGNYNSKIGETAYERMKDEPFAQPGALYEDQVERIMAYIRASRDRYKEPDEVAEAIQHALEAETPLRRYMVVPNEMEARWTITKAIEELAQLNEWQAYQYSREELIDMLDDALATRTSDSAELASVVEEFLAKTNQRETHEAFWAPDLVYTSSNGTRFGKAQILEGFDAEPEIADDWPAYSAEDMQVRIHGDTGIVTFKLVGTPAADSGEPTAYYFNTGTFLKRDGQWRAIAWQATAIPE